MTNERLDTFICVHHRDVGYLLKLVLGSYDLNFIPKNKLFMVTNDVSVLRNFVDEIGWGQRVTITSDQDWLSKAEMQLPGWFKQQLIKLRAYQFCETPNFCNLGADTVLLQPIHEHDLVHDGKPILYYTQHRLPDNHYRYERERVGHIGRLLKTEPTTARQYMDFINDLFCFNRESLMSLEAYMEEMYGSDPYVNLLKDMPDTSDNRNKFGEWTLYSVYLLDKLKQDILMRNTRSGFLHQVHSRLSLLTYRFNTKVVHFVGKDFDLDYIRKQLVKHTPELAKCL